MLKKVKQERYTLLVQGSLNQILHTQMSAELSPIFTSRLCHLQLSQEDVSKEEAFRMGCKVVPRLTDL